MPVLSLEEIHELSARALVSAGARQDVADIVAQSITDAEADGVRKIGLDYLPVYCRHLQCGKVDGHAVPTFETPRPGVLRGNAKSGFCHAAFVAGESLFFEMARTQGVAAFGINQSYASGVLGWFVARIANEGLVGLGFSNASPTMAPFGGTKPVFGTNPIALGVPYGITAPLVIDVSPAATTRLDIKRHCAAGEAIPTGWGLDSQGMPTNDPDAVLNGGTVAPAAGHKGSALALLIELMAAGLTGANWSVDASDLGDDEGAPPGIGQFFLGIDPGATAGHDITANLASLLTAITSQDNVRVPGCRRLESRKTAHKKGVVVSEKHLEIANGRSCK